MQGFLGGGGGGGGAPAVRPVSPPKKVNSMEGARVAAQDLSRGLSAARSDDNASRLLQLAHVLNDGGLPDWTLDEELCRAFDLPRPSTPLRLCRAACAFGVAPPPHPSTTT